MKTMIAATAALVGLSACSQQPVATDNQTAAAAPADTMPGDLAMNDPANPYADAMTKMNRDMMGARGANVSETYARMMIPHHQGAIDMSNVLLAQGGDEKFLAKARMVSADMRKEIGTLQGQLQSGLTAGTSTGSVNPFGPAMQKMDAAMMSATGATPGETWARKMIAHHQGAIGMSEAVLRQGGDPKALATARMTIDKQNKEIAELEGMLKA